MRRIINGRKYDTSTAGHIGNYNNGLRESDFRYIDEDLYRKENGEFFLAGEGGPLTKYAEHGGPGELSWSGRNLIPMTDEEAREWVEDYLGYAEYVAIFGEPNE